MKKDTSQNEKNGAALADAVVQAITQPLRGTEQRKALRQATQQPDDVLEEVMASGTVQRRFAQALSAYFVEHIPRVLHELLTKAAAEGASPQAKMFLDLGGTGDRVQSGDEPEEEAQDTTVEDLEEEMVKNLREMMLSDANETEED